MSKLLPGDLIRLNDGLGAGHSRSGHIALIIAIDVDGHPKSRMTPSSLDVLWDDATLGLVSSAFVDRL
jgi:hypothetical protein